MGKTFSQAHLCRQDVMTKLHILFEVVILHLVSHVSLVVGGYRKAVLYIRYSVIRNGAVG